MPTVFVLLLIVIRSLVPVSRSLRVSDIHVFMHSRSRHAHRPDIDGHASSPARANSATAVFLVDTTTTPLSVTTSITCAPPTRGGLRGLRHTLRLLNLD
jgi:hypothetical protein